MNSTTVTYTRGTTFVKENTRDCYGLVGELEVGGYLFDTLERYAKPGEIDYVHLPVGDYTRGVMYWLKPSQPVKKDGEADAAFEERMRKWRNNPGKRVLNPMAGTVNPRFVNILLHYGEKPHWFEGCIGPGFLQREGESSSLSLSSQSMEIIFEACGGKAGNKDGWVASSPRVCFRVANAFPDRKTLTAHRG